MIIDLILDRKDGKNYNPEAFYDEVTRYGEVGFNIADALDNGTEIDVKNALIDYMVAQGYSDKVIDYINSQKWL